MDSPEMLMCCCCSTAETFVMQIVAKDDDQAGTINSEISYSIISQEPAGDGHMFTIDKKTGKIHVKEATLDREVRILLSAHRTH